MKKNIIGTIATKFFSAVLNFFLLILTTQFLGAEGKGEIGIFVLNLTVILMLSDVVGGAGLIYVIPRSDVFKVALSSYSWGLFVSSFLTLIFFLFNFTKIEFLAHLFFLSLFLNVLTINNNILVAKEKIEQSNWISFIQIIIQVLSFGILVFIAEVVGVHLYFYSLYFSYGTSVIIGFFLIRKQMLSKSLDGLFIEIRKMFQYGIFVQLGNFIQLMNYRLSFYLLEHFHSASAVGIYSTGTLLAEAVWLICNSIARVQYSRISNTTDISYAQNMSIRLSKVSLLATVLAALPLILLPANFYEFIFGAGFSDVKKVIVTLTVGVCAFGLTSIYSHYFAGTGKVYINTIAASIGLIFTLVFGFVLIPHFGFLGAGVTSSISYFVTSVFLTIIFLRQTKISTLHLIPLFNDIRFFIDETKKILRINPSEKQVQKSE